MHINYMCFVTLMHINCQWSKNFHTNISLQFECHSSAIFQFWTLRTLKKKFKMAWTWHTERLPRFSAASQGSALHHICDMGTDMYLVSWVFFMHCRHLLDIESRCQAGALLCVPYDVSTQTFPHVKYVQHGTRDIQNGWDDQAGIMMQCCWLLVLRWVSVFPIGRHLRTDSMLIT